MGKINQLIIMALSQQKIRAMFPTVKFAFYGDYITRYQRKLI